MKALSIESDLIPVTESEEHEYTLSTELVAKGYGVSESVIRSHKSNHSEDLLESKHWIACVANMDAGTPPRKETLWTKRGVIRLGFFIRSERARLFRDLAEDLVVRAFSEEIQNYSIALFLQEVPEAWEKRFPNSFFRAVADCYGISYIKGRTPGFVGGFINRYVYEPLLNNLSGELKASPRAP